MHETNNRINIQDIYSNEIKKKSQVILYESVLPSSSMRLTSKMHLVGRGRKSKRMLSESTTKKYRVTSQI
jgi:hypothetical protein